MRKLQLFGLLEMLSWAAVLSLGFIAFTFVVNAALADSKPASQDYSGTNIDEKVRAGSRVKPSPALQSAIRKFMEQDKSASFNYYLGHVDSFSSHPKPTVPTYAREILPAHGLSTNAQANEQLPVFEDEKPTQNLDVDLDQLMPLPYEDDIKERQPAVTVADDNAPRDSVDEAKMYTRVKPARYIEEQKALWVVPDKQTLAREASVAKLILLSFLKQYQKVFELESEDLQAGLPNLTQTGYTVGRYARKAVFQQSLGGEPIIGGKMIVMFDRNWNVVAISRMIPSHQKLGIAESFGIQKSKASAIGVEALAKKTKTDAKLWKLVSAVLGVDPIRRKRLWVITARVPRNNELDMRVKLDAATGEVLNISDNVDRYEDAKVRRWGYLRGDLNNPSQYVESGFYTRDDLTLVHDFFHIVNDERGGGDPQTTCTETGQNSLWYEDAYGTQTGSSYVRPTRRGDRDFSLWYPHNPSGSFSESNSYYWARWFFQWVKGSISDLGKLPTLSADYPRVLIVTSACISAGGIHNSTFELTTDDDQGEGIPVIRLPEKCRSSNANCTPADYTGFATFKTCEGNGCSSPPSVIHHEINHFLLKAYYEVDSGLDCGSSEQLKFLHEGILGSVVPQAYWHHYYGVGYNPSDNFLYKADYDAGRVHVDEASNITLSDYFCDDDGDPYKSGRVAGQVMWEIYHGKAVNGADITRMARPSTDRDFLVLTYWAAELVDASMYKDRYEMANRVMQIMEYYSAISASGKQKWCDAWDHHQLRTFINNSYCS